MLTSVSIDDIIYTVGILYFLIHEKKNIPVLNANNLLSILTNLLSLLLIIYFTNTLLSYYY